MYLIAGEMDNLETYFGIVRALNESSAKRIGKTD